MRVGAAMLVVPLILFLVSWEGSDARRAGEIASWPAFLLWPIGALFVSAGLVGRFIRKIDDRLSPEPGDRRPDDPRTVE